MVRMFAIWVLLTVVLTLAISSWKSWRLKSTFSVLKWSGYGILGATIATVISFIIIELF